ncbi:type 1 glutamine amidotransferase domain-containing protein [Nocardia sp. alder85J]|uniref:type 1 glutamine amidotransferase domain-containing protein n=1 Tax=Nocardia sp. alder85J TaxID=2862949 RepID=UPI001CD32600|nr:type 1 glutamine amidotransferase domain-containing protein [Nocardia sp. alder85J]MCX4092980.1 type 1 glutamine amidotransferase [Nocardia sp. alder85J]
MPGQLQDARVLIVTSNTGVEHDELVVPRDRLRQRGARVIHAAEHDAPVRTYHHDLEPDEEIRPDTTLDAVDPSEVDLLIVPGGTVNADRLRANDYARRLVRAAAGAWKPIAAVCHGPWLLVDAGVLPGKRLTSYPTLSTDIRNARGEWVDRPVVRDDSDGWTLITSRRPADLPDFVDAITRELTD